MTSRLFCRAALASLAILACCTGCRDHGRLQASASSDLAGGGGARSFGRTGAQIGDELALCYPASGTTKRVAGSAALANALRDASPGERIVLAPGDYGGTYTLSRSGTAAAPIVILGGSGVAMPGTLELNGDYAVVAGITFPNGSVQIAGDYNRVTRNLFKDFSRIAVGVSGGAYNRIDHNEFADMSSAGGERGYVAVNIGPAPTTTTTRGNRIDHNYFHDYPDWGMNGHEAIWLGSHMRQITIVTETLVDHNYLENIDSDGEIIKVTTDRNFLVGNTFVDSRGYASSRQGKGHVWKNNYFENVNGLRVHGDDHQIVGNTFVSATLRLIAGDTTYDAIAAKLPEYDLIHPSARRALVSGNKGPVVVGYRYGDLPASDNVIEANDGPVRKEVEERTTVRPAASVAAGTARKLSKADVGPSAPDPSCAPARPGG